MARSGSARAKGWDTNERGVTLLEMLVVVILISLVAGISFPSISSGLDSIRLASAANSVVSFLDSALNRAERRQQVVEVTIDPKANALVARSTEVSFERQLQMPDGILIAAVLPRLEIDDLEVNSAPRRFYLYPGGSVPGFGIELATRKGTQRIVRVDPITGVPQIQKVPTGGSQ
ncbi:MAG TPA: prepilin-type N-terminal cleavage/methylation domain-containing protein [Bryobacteraceae bacterium]|nr:prepilin-type N-terminal cleavage/methylation domain-containing protein [Bryobacteraceae bacterium]